MANVISDFLIDRVKTNGWLSVGNIMFEDAMPCINPTTSAGCVCLSPSKELIFSLVRFDTHTSFVVEEGFLSQDYRNHGVQQTIVCEPFDRLRHFDILLLTPTVRQDPDETMFMVPQYPKVADVEGITLDPETGLADISVADQIETVDGLKHSAINIYPDITNYKEYVGIRVKEYQEFIKAQKKFCKLVEGVSGISDLI